MVLLPNIQYDDLSSLVQYMYTGQVFIHQDMLGRLLKTAQALQVKGLIEESADRTVGMQVSSHTKLTAVKLELFAEFSTLCKNRSKISFLLRLNGGPIVKKFRILKCFPFKRLFFFFQVLNQPVLR